MAVVDRVELTGRRIQSQRPDLDLTGWNLLSRAARLWFLAAEALSEALRPFGLTQHEYVVLASLRDNGPPYASSPSRLLESALITTSGGLTNMLHRLEREGLIVRAPDAADRRGVIVSLTDKGLERVQAASEAYLSTANQLVSSLGVERTQELTRALREFLILLDPVMEP